MLKLILSLLLAAGVVTVAHARTCTTTCNTYGGQTTCTQNCW